MSETRELAELSSDKWKDKYLVYWCQHCDVAVIECPSCHNTSCNAGGCPECLADYEEWKKVYHNVQNYLTPSERLAYEKGHRLKRLITDSIARGEIKLNFKKLFAEGRLSRNHEEIFAAELK